MHCRRNVRRLIEEYRAAVPADRPTTALMRFRAAVVALKAAPSRLAPPHTQANRYDDYVYIHQQSMAGHPAGDPGPHPGHRGPMFFPWHREFLRRFEQDLRAVSGDPTICLPYWDWSVDKTPADSGYPFFAEFLGGDGAGPTAVVADGVFARANGWVLALADAFDNSPQHQANLSSLQRQLGISASAPTLPTRDAVIAALAEDTYDAAPWNINAPDDSSFRNRVEGWVGPQAGGNTHNRVHLWVGGSMLPGTSPNDPVFFLNHAKEDQLWATWMQKHPTAARYLPGDDVQLPAGHTHLKRLSDHMDGLAEYFGGATLDRPVNLLDHKAITWYDTDLPDIVVESGPALGFVDVPAGATIGRRIRFRIRSCRPVHFSVTATPTGNFAVVGGPDFTVVPDPARDTEFLEVEVRFHAVGANVQVAAVDLRASVVDAEGYYANNPGDPFVVGTFYIDLVASNIVTTDSSIALVLDRSGSMADVVAGGMTKNALLKGAVGVLHSLLHDGDELGIARFDDVSDAVLPMSPKAAGLGAVLTGPDLDPRGATSIGAGLLVGSALISGPGATHPNQALIVLTDGNENTAPLVRDLPAGTVDRPAFAIGFGRPDQVSAPVLAELSANTGGYLLITGPMGGAAERFTLAKFFIQVLKDATRNQTVVDPPGALLWNQGAQSVPFLLSGSDMSADVVVLCPVPQLLDVVLVAPGGAELTRETPATEPNVAWVVDAGVAYFRLLLPALAADPTSSHAGTWTAVLRLRNPEDVLQELADTGDDDAVEAFLHTLRELGDGPLPYQHSVHTFSDLRLDAALQQRGREPGTEATILASLREYDQPLGTAAKVWADITPPDEPVDRVELADVGGGLYTATYPLRLVGAYRVLVHAVGTSPSSGPFAREKLVTGGVWEGGDRPWEPVLDGGAGRAVDGPAHEPTEAEGVTTVGSADVLGSRTTDRTTQAGQDDQTGLPARGDRAAAEAFVAELAARARAGTPATSSPVVRVAPRGGAPGNLFLIDAEPVEPVDPPETEEPHEHGSPPMLG